VSRASRFGASFSRRLRRVESWDNAGELPHPEEERRFDEIERRVGYVRARLRLLPTEQGGRRTAILSGYRPQWDLGYRTDEGEIAYCDAQVRLEDVASLAPGDEGTVRLHPFFPEYWRDVEPGVVLALYEGNRRLGEARVLEVARPESVASRDEAAQLWAEHQEADFPARLRGEEVASVDMVMLDADVAGCVQTWLGSKRRLGEPHRSYVTRCLDDLNRVLPLLDDPSERRYYERLRALAQLALDSSPAGSRDT
jgi:hypothetical protein